PLFLIQSSGAPRALPSLPTRRSSDLSELLAGPRRAVATRTRVIDSRASSFRSGHVPRRADAGSPAGEQMIMTRNKAQKAATRQRMAETGEPYSVARKAAGAGAEDPGSSETPADSGSSGTTAKQDLHEAPDEHRLRATREEQYLREPGEAGVAAADLGRLRVGLQARGRAGQLRQAAEQARERAELAEEAAAQAEERAELAQEAADLAQDWADEDEQRLAQERADRMQQAADRAREQADQAEEAAEQAEERAEEAEDLGSRAHDLVAGGDELDD